MAKNKQEVIEEETISEKNTSKNEEVKNDINANEKKENKTTKRKVVEPLEDYDEIEVVSLIPNVNYKDSKTGDIYEWDEVGHVEYMTFETLKNLWRGYKGYFRNMWLKPCDDRVIAKFGLNKLFEKYDMLMDENNYTRDNVDEICKSILETPNGLKRSICNKVKDLVSNGKITDVKVIRALEKHLDLELIDFL